MVDEKWLFIKKPSYITNVNGRLEGTFPHVP
jgi:hypothetical protein